METRDFLQIVSGFKPEVDGMGDFAKGLADGLWLRAGVRSHFLVNRRPKTGLDPRLIAPHTISYPDAPTPEALMGHAAELVKRHKFAAVMLHYGPYAYSHDGLPAEFARAVKAFSEGQNLLVFFHETWAFARPWKRAFWTFPNQKRAMRLILSAAKAAFTSTDLFLYRLGEMNSTGVDLRQVRIFSNVGELENPTRLRDRARQLVLFGHLTTRLHVYRRSLSDLAKICQLLRIETVMDIGSGVSPLIPETIGAAVVRRCGYMNEEKLSALLANSRAGVVAYGPEYWEKSGVLSTYESHAMVPLLVPREDWTRRKPTWLPFRQVEELAEMAGADGTVSEEKLQEIADAAYEHYKSNQSLSRAVAVIAPHVTLG